MGITHVTAIVRNPADPERTWEGLFLVDTGAIDCLVPMQHLTAIGLAPKGQRVHGLADGSEIRMDITPATSSSWGKSPAQPSSAGRRTLNPCWE